MSNKLNYEITGVIKTMAHDGSGLMPRPLGKPYLVYHTIPGEEVVALTQKRDKKGIKAELQKVIKPSPHRVEPVCPMVKLCGGCKWQHISYEHQLVIKKGLIEQAFATKQIELPTFSVVRGENKLFYRNRMDFMFGRNGELGLKEAGRWWSVIDLPKCFLMSEESNEILSRLRIWTRASGLPFWDNKKYTGFFRALIIREGKNTNERLVMLVTNKADDQKTKNLISSLPEVLGDLATSIVWGINDQTTDLSIANEIIPIKGNPWLEEIINGIRYKISPCSFFQTNSDMAAQLQNTVLEFVKPAGKNIADLYCGAGFFSLALVKAGAKNVIGVEADEAGIQAAKQNAELNNVGVLESWSGGLPVRSPAKAGVVEFVTAKIEDYFKDKKLAAGFDMIILDPPRAGLHPKVIETLLEVLPPEIVYVSCNFNRLAEELPKFLEHYKIADFRALDLFPQTPHVEAVIKLIKK
ncbi:MAG: 23S rRNA (uracil(1939)-C(5))-methyltransferase RlmD [Candidatus Uhrbacteria bacterium]